MIEFQQHGMDGAPYREDWVEVDRQPDQVARLLTEQYGITISSPSFERAGSKGIAIEGFAPTPANIRCGAYILSRPLLLVTQAPPSIDVKRFIEFMLGPEGQAIVAQKFVSVR